MKNLLVLLLVFVLVLLNTSEVEAKKDNLGHPEIEYLAGILVDDSRMRCFLIDREPVIVNYKGIVIRFDENRKSEHPMVTEFKSDAFFGHNCYTGITFVFRDHDEYEKYIGEAMNNYQQDDIGDCFIATAAYGTPSHQNIDILRNFRDSVLSRNWLGNKFVNWYYDNGPTMASWVRKTETRKALVRGVVVKPSVFLITTPTQNWVYAFVLSLMLCLVSRCYVYSMVK